MAEIECETLTKPIHNTVASFSNGQQPNEVTFNDLHNPAKTEVGGRLGLLIKSVVAEIERMRHSPSPYNTGLILNKLRTQNEVLSSFCIEFKLSI